MMSPFIKMKKITEIEFAENENWKDMPENFATIDDYIRHSIEEIKILKQALNQREAENEKLRQDNHTLALYSDYLYKQREDYYDDIKYLTELVEQLKEQL